MNAYRNKNRIFVTVILLTFLFSLIFPTSTVFADDTIPPEEITEVVDAPVEEDTPSEGEGASEGETPDGEEQDGEEPDAEEPMTEEALPEEPPAEETVTEEVATEEPASEGEDAETEPVLAQVPEGTDVVVLDEEGEAVPLATQEAAEAIATSDPMWCPDGVNPIANTGGCTDSYTSMTDLLAALSGAGQPAVNGTIWIEATYDSSTAEPGGTTNITIDGNSGNFSSWRDHSLTVQGGWDGTSSGTITGTSLFSGDRFRIINWQNNVTINDIVIDGASGGASLEIEIDTPSTNTFDVTLNNVEVRNNTNNRGARIDNDESTGSVTINNSTFTNNGDSTGDDEGLFIDARGNVTLLNVIATGNNDEGVDIRNTDSSVSATVEINGTNVFTGNGGVGLRIRSDGNVSLNNITANNNGGDGVNIENQTSSTRGFVSFTGTNVFNSNNSDGLYVRSDGYIALNDVTANDNINDSGVRLDNNEGGADASSFISITGTNLFSGNNDYGLEIDSRGAVNLNNITADGNRTQDGVNIDNCIWGGSTIGCLGSGDVTITGTQVFTNNGNGNGDDGLYVNSAGNVTLANVIATGNRDEGVEIHNQNSTTNATVTIGGTNLFSGNTGDGLYIQSDGAINLNNITANSSVNDSGARIDNDENGANSGSTVTLTGTNTFNGNNDHGLEIDSRGAVSLNNVTANNNVTQYGVNVDNANTGASAGVTLTGTNSFNNNDDYGLEIDSFGAVALNNITADGNKTQDGVNIDNCKWNGTLAICRGSGDVTITGTQVFTNNGNGNGDDGLYVATAGSVTLANVIATGNRDEGVEIHNQNSTTNATVTIGGTNLFSGNTGNGLYIQSDGAISLNNITANSSVNDSGAIIDNNESGANLSSTVTITGTNSFSGNNDYGLRIYSLSAVALNNITADSNRTQDGANIDNDNTGSSGDVTITGTNSFSSNGNGDDGLFIASRGDVTLENVTASDNSDHGVVINNRALNNGATVSLNGINVISNNADDGLVIQSSGSIYLNEITADGNGAGTADNGAEIRNTYGPWNGDVIITGYNNSFSNNSGPGLDIDTDGNIELYFATIEDNNQAGGSDGANFNTPGSANVYCSVFGNNSGIGLDAWNVDSSLTFNGMDGFTDYSYNGTAGFANYNCNMPSASRGGSAKITSFIPVTGVCDPFTVEEKFVDNDLEILVLLNNLCEYSVALDFVPTDIPVEIEQLSGLEVTITLLSDNSVVTELPPSTSMQLLFEIPENMAASEELAVMYWDPFAKNGDGEWVELETTVDNGQAVVFLTPGTPVLFPASFALVDKNAIE